jgi:alkylhydroperoxidase family enzyme
LARRQGWSEDQLEHLADYPRRDDFTPAEKAALRLSEVMSLDSNGVGEEMWSDLRHFYDEGEIIELTAAIGLFNYFNRFNNALKIEPTK